MPAASAHVLVTPGHDCHAVRADLETLLATTYQISHTTLQVDHAPTTLLGVGTTGEQSEAHCDDAHGPVHRPAAAQPRRGD